MRPVEFDEQNTVFSAEGCMDLPVFKGIDTNGDPCLFSCWELTREDLDEINRTGKLWLRIYGHATPPVGLMTEYPFIKKET